MRATLLRITIVALLASLAAIGGAQADSSVEYAIKGAYLYKFLPFVDWPQSSFPTVTTPFTICILGRDPFGSGLDHAVADVRVNGRAIAIRRIDAPDPSCHIVYAGDGLALQALDGRPVLTVTDSGAKAQGIISFVIEGDHVRFDVDDAAAAKGGLSISSKLLSLARSVKARGGQP